MTHALQPRRIGLTASCHLLLDPDPDAPQRYLVRFCGLDRDRAAQAATEHARVRQMMANLRGHAVYPYPLPQRVTIGAFDQAGWHCGNSEYARALAGLPFVQKYPTSFAPICCCGWRWFRHAGRLPDEPLPVRRSSAPAIIGGEWAYTVAAGNRTRRRHRGRYHASPATFQVRSANINVGQ